MLFHYSKLNYSQGKVALLPWPFSLITIEELAYIKNFQIKNIDWSLINMHAEAVFVLQCFIIFLMIFHYLCSNIS